MASRIKKNGNKKSCYFRLGKDRETFKCSGYIFRNQKKREQRMAVHNIQDIRTVCQKRHSKQAFGHFSIGQLSTGIILCRLCELS